MPSPSGKTIVITGASSGIGAEAAVDLAHRGHTIVPIGRSEQKLEAVSARILAAGQEKVTPIQADLATMAEVRRTANEILGLCPRIDVLINNAGVLEPTKALTDDGFERTWAINHLAPFLLTMLLRDRLEASEPARVITTSSTAANQGRIYTDDIASQFAGERFGTAMRTYSATKLANALFSLELSRRWADTPNTSNHVHPGTVDTGWGRDTWWLKAGKAIARGLVFTTPLQGARSLIHVADDPEGGEQTGVFYNPKAKVMRARARTRDIEVAHQLWRASEDAVGVKWDYTS